MIKIYRYNQPKGYVRVQLVSNGGVKCFVAFENGNPGTKECPTCSIRNPFWQMVMEDTLCKRGIAKLVQTITEDEEKSLDMPVQFTNVEDVDTLEKAIDYCAREWQVVVKTRQRAINEAHKHGVDFPNLK